jgi:hypothetical protein
MLAGVELVWTAKRDRNGDCATGQGGPAARRRVIRPASSRVTVSSVRKRSCTLCGIPNGPDIEFDLATGHWCNTFWAHCILAVGLGERCRVLATRVGPACDTICAGRWGLTAGTCMGNSAMMERNSRCKDGHLVALRLCWRRPRCCWRGARSSSRHGLPAAAQRGAGMNGYMAWRASTTWPCRQHSAEQSASAFCMKALAQ